MSDLTIIWVFLPLFLGLSSYLLPRFDRYCALITVLASLGYGIYAILSPTPLNLELLDRYGVTVMVDQLSGFFILTNALVSAAVLAYCWPLGKPAVFYAQLLIVHGSLNAIFISADFISVYVGLETLALAAFLLIAYDRSERCIWVSLRYLFVSSVAMLFYLVGAVLVYKATQSFAFTGLTQAPIEAIALIFLGLLTKGGVFISGLWLPITHAEAESPVSAILSGVVVKAGIFPLVRLALMFESVLPMVQIFGMASAWLGVVYALFETDIKRLFALSTISQVGFILVAPVAGGFYTLAHGLAKACLFLTAGFLPTRNLPDLRQTEIPAPLWFAMTLPALSISGFPFLAGYGAKASSLDQLLGGQSWLMNGAALGTVLVFGNIIFMPVAWDSGKTTAKSMTLGAWVGVGILLGGLILGNAFYLSAYTGSKLWQTLGVIGVGWLGYWVLIRRMQVRLPTFFERFQQLIGLMSIILTLLFWGAWA